MLDFIYDMTLKLIENHIFGVKTSIFLFILRNVIMEGCTEQVNLFQGNKKTDYPATHTGRATHKFHIYFE